MLSKFRYFALFVLLPFVFIAQSQIGKYTLNGPVNTLAIDKFGNTYIGGSFTSIGVYRGGGVKFSSAGVLDTNFVKVVGGVYAAVAIPNHFGGGWFVGGSFYEVNGVKRKNLARINSDGTIHPFNPIVEGFIYSMILDTSGNLYIGGGITTVSGLVRNNLAKFDKNCTLTSFNPNLDGWVNSLALDPSGDLYVGGEFTMIGGSTVRNYLAKFNSSGALTSFNPNLNQIVYTLTIDQSRSLYVGGVFDSVRTAGVNRNYLCKFDSTGAITSFDPNMNNAVRALAIDTGNNLYAGGYFTLVGGSIIRNKIAKFNNAGALTSFNPNINGAVYSLATTPSGILYVCGEIDSIGGIARKNFAKFDASGTLTSFNPIFNYNTNCVGIDASDNIYVCGGFTSIGNDSIRNNLAKFLPSGELSNFNPNLNSMVLKLEVDTAANLYVGGDFTMVGSTMRNFFAKFNSAGSLSGFNPDANGWVRAFVIDAANNLYIGGSFTTLDGGSTSRNRLAKYDPSGTLTSFDSDINGDVLALAIDTASNLYVGGAYNLVGGVTTRNCLAKYDASGTLTSFNPDLNNLVLDLVVDKSNNLFVGGGFTLIGNTTTRNNLAKFSSAGALTAFNPNMNDFVFTLKLDNAENLFIGGSFTQVSGGIPRNYFAKYNSSGILSKLNSNIVGSVVHDIDIDTAGHIHMGGNYYWPRGHYSIFNPKPVLSLASSTENDKKLTRTETYRSTIYYGDSTGHFLAIDTAGITSGSLTGDTITIHANKTIDSFKSSNGANQEHAMFLMPRYWNAKGNFTGTIKLFFPYYHMDTQAMLLQRNQSWTTLKATTNVNSLAVKSTKLEWFKTVGLPYDSVWKSNIIGNRFPSSHIKLTPIYKKENVVDYVEFSGITSFSGGSAGFAYGPPGASGLTALDIAWIRFEVWTTDVRNNLEWITASEDNTNYYQVEYSFDAKQWIIINEKIYSTGNSVSMNKYGFRHSIFEPLVFYRIKQVDHDGRISYSEIKIANRNNIKSFQFSIFPTQIPENGRINFEAKNIDKSLLSIRILDLSGKLVYAKVVLPDSSFHSEELDLSVIKKGIYFVEIENQQGKIALKLVR